MELGRWWPLTFLPLKHVFSDSYNPNLCFKFCSNFSYPKSPSHWYNLVLITECRLVDFLCKHVSSFCSKIQLCSFSVSQVPIPSHIKWHRSLGLNNSCSIFSRNRRIWHLGTWCIVLPLNCFMCANYVLLIELSTVQAHCPWFALSRG